MTTVDALPMALRADVASVSPEARTAEVIFSTGAPVERFDWMTGERYLEELSLKASHVRLSRLNAGGPLLDSHSSYRLGSQLGAIVRGSARVEQGRAVATVRFSKRADVEPIFQDVRDGIVSSVSVGYRVHRFDVTKASGQSVERRLATDWEPFEISLVSMPADVGAKVRDGDKSGTNRCVMVRAADMDRDRLFRLMQALGQ